MPLSPGQILNHRYRIDKLLGQGGFGAVYYAWDANLESPRAIKENLNTSPQAQHQFKREAQILDKLAHPNLPRVIDHFIIPGQGQYLVMDFIDGEDLQDKLRKAGGPLPESLLLPWMAQVCEALSYLHAQNPAVIHRDVKPGNIKITSEGRAVLVDFGIAKEFDPNLRTTVGARALTSGYSPPEQYGRGVTDAQSDVYALGATLYHLITGQMPPDSVDRLSGNAPQLIPAQALNPAVSPQVSAAIEKAMRLERGERWSSVQAFKDALALPQTPVDPALAVTVPRVTASPVHVSPPSSSTPSSTQPSRAPLPKPRFALLTSWARRKAWILSLLLGIPLICVFCITVFLLRRSALFSAIPNPTAISAPVTAAPIPSSPATPNALAPMPQFMSDDHGVKMALIPAGEFQMGRDGGADYEKPVHAVFLDAFYIDVYEVTNRLYAQCVQAGACAAPGMKSSVTHPSYYGSSAFDDYPVIYVDWGKAKAYCEWRGGELPTEAQWEKAARGGLQGKQFPWGDASPDCSKANFLGKDGGCKGDTTPVGSYSPNGYGLYDMAGNVWEWVNDWYQSSYYRVSPPRNPPGAASGSSRVTRGGGWHDAGDILRVSERYYADPGFRHYYFGFRCAAPPGP